MPSNTSDPRIKKESRSQSEIWESANNVTGYNIAIILLFMIVIILFWFGYSDINSNICTIFWIMIFLGILNIVYGLRVVERKEYYYVVSIEKGRYIEADFVVIFGWLQVLFGILFIILMIFGVLYVSVMTI